MKAHYLLLLMLVLSALGCGGDKAVPSTATISGRVTFIDGQPARDVAVTTRSGATRTNSNGSYILNNIRASDEFISVDFTDNGVRFVGQNLARGFDGEQTASVNILAVPSDRQARITGVVEDRDGNPLSNATVFAFADGAISSSRAVTNKKGEYTIDRLIADVPYEINAGGAGYRSDTESVTLGRGESRFLRMILGNPGFPGLPTPQAVDAIAWTAPRTRDAQWNSAFQNIKRVAFGQAPRATTRLSPNGNPIEIEVVWDFVTGTDVLGFAIYRGRDNGAISGFDFLRDPLANTYLDGDVNLVAGTRYWYQVTTASVRYPDEPGSEGTRSSAVSARPLGDLELNGVSDRTITWRPVPDADQYRVFLFDRYPSTGVDSVNDGTVTGSNYTVPVGVLGAGRRYYYLVIGTSESQKNRTVSEVGTFVYGNP
jgi:hypothetical protein